MFAVQITVAKFDYNDNFVGNGSYVLQEQYELPGLPLYIAAKINGDGSDTTYRADCIHLESGLTHERLMRFVPAPAPSLDVLMDSDLPF